MELLNLILIILLILLIILAIAVLYINRRRRRNVASITPTPITPTPTPTPTLPVIIDSLSVESSTLDNSVTITITTADDELLLSTSTTSSLFRPSSNSAAINVPIKITPSDGLSPPPPYSIHIPAGSNKGSLKLVNTSNLQLDNVEVEILLTDDDPPTFTISPTISSKITIPTVVPGSYWRQVGLDIDGETADDESGYSVSMSSDGMRVAIGAKFNKGANNLKPDSGHVRVYQLNIEGETAEWIQLGLDIDGEGVDDWSGWSVSMGGTAGNRVAIGARYNKGANNEKSYSGHVRVFEYRGSTAGWIQLGDDIDGENFGDESGYSVSMGGLDGNRVAIGAKFNKGANNEKRNSGHVRVFEYDTSTATPKWKQLGDDIDGENVNDFSGVSVSMGGLNGNRVAIGAPSNKGANGTEPSIGHVRVYELNIDGETAEWKQLGADIDGETAYDESGFSVSMGGIDGNRVAIGAYLNDGNGIDSGHVRVYELNIDGETAEWKQLGDDIDGENVGDESGISVSMSSDGMRVAIGAHYNKGANNLKPGSGHVRVFEYHGSTAGWQQLGLDIDGEEASDYSGQSVSMGGLDGNRVAIGAHYNKGANNEKENSGHVRVFELKKPTPTPTGWTQLGADIYGDTADGIGSSVSMSHDGNRMAIGAPYNNSGYVRVYGYNNNIDDGWTQLGHDIYGETADDKSGYSVSMGGLNGNRVAIGAYGNDGANGTEYNIGHVRVYEYRGSTAGWTQLGLDIDGETGFDNSGYSVSMGGLDGNRVAIGAPYNDGNGDLSGHVRVYEYNSIADKWEKLGLDIDGNGVDDWSGWSVSMGGTAGNRVAIGAPFNNGNSGRVRVFEYRGGTAGWAQLGGDIYGETAYDFSGFSVSMDGIAGNRVAIGAKFNDGANNEKPDSGHVRVFELNIDGDTAEWIQLGEDIDGDTADDNSGVSVSLSSDGTLVAIGAPGTGHVRTYKYNGSNWIRGDIIGGNGYSVSMGGSSRVAIGGAGYIRTYELI